MDLQSKNLEELQLVIQQFVQERNWQRPPADVLIHLIEEMGEVARNILILNNYGGQHTSDKKTNLDEELADVLYLLLKLANETNINLSLALQTKMQKNALRFPPEKKSL